MALRDYEFAQLARHTGKISISIKCLTRPIDCQPSLCSGLCCRLHNPSLTSHYHTEELYRLPSDLRNLLNEDNSVRVDDKGNCLLIPHCLANPSIIPTECRLFPLGFNKSGRLIYKKWIMVSKCPAFNTGQPAYISMKQCLIDVFGEEIYGKIVKEVEAAPKLL